LWKLRLGEFTNTTGDLFTQSIFTEVATADAIRELLQVRQDLLDAPAAAEIVADDGVKSIAPVGSLRRTNTNDLLDLIDAVAAAVTVGAVDDRRRGGRSSLT
jgi:hypothetical protein